MKSYYGGSVSAPPSNLRTVEASHIPDSGSVIIQQTQRASRRRKQEVGRVSNQEPPQLVGLSLLKPPTQDAEGQDAPASQVPSPPRRTPEMAQKGKLSRCWVAEEPTEAVKHSHDVVRCIDSGSTNVKDYR